MSQQVQVGIDVSADSFSVAYEMPGQALHETRMDNSAAGYRKLCRLLTRGGRPARVCLEATGIYSLDLALALREKSLKRSLRRWSPGFFLASRCLRTILVPSVRASCKGRITSSAFVSGSIG